MVMVVGNSRLRREQECRQIASHRFGLEPSEWTEKSIYVLKAGDMVRLEAECTNSFEIRFIGVAFPAGPQARVQLFPNFMIFTRVMLNQFHVALPGTILSN
jgi:hypothetical protein